MSTNAQERLIHAVRNVADFPKPGIQFKDITPLLADPELLKLAIEQMVAPFQGQKIDKVIGVDARGFIFGALVAAALNCGFVPARKAGKLPWKTQQVTYDLEYGQAVLELHEDAIAPGERVILADDLLATGGTAEAALKLATALQAEIVGCVFLIELGFLGGRAKIESYGPVHGILKY